MEKLCLACLWVGEPAEMYDGDGSFACPACGASTEQIVNADEYDHEVENPHFNG